MYLKSYSYLKSNNQKTPSPITYLFKIQHKLNTFIFGMPYFLMY